MTTCKHGVPGSDKQDGYSEGCGFCNPKPSKVREYDTAEDRFLDSIIPTNNETFWTEDEYSSLFDKFEGGNVVRTSKSFKKVVRETAKLLGRTRKSIIWHYMHMFVIPNDPKAGQVLSKFKKDLGIITERR